MIFLKITGIAVKKNSSILLQVSRKNIGKNKINLKKIWKSFIMEWNSC